MRLTEVQRNALSFAQDGMHWQYDCDARFIGTNNFGKHYASRYAIDLFAAGALDGKGRITPAGRSALAQSEEKK